MYKSKIDRRITPLKLASDINGEVNLYAYLNEEKIYEYIGSDIGNVLPKGAKIRFERYCNDSRVFSFNIILDKDVILSKDLNYFSRSTFNFYEESFTWADPLNNPVVYFEG